MKFQAASATLLSLFSTAAGQYDTTIPGPVCAKFKTIKVQGLGEFVDTDGSGLVPITTGKLRKRRSSCPNNCCVTIRKDSLWFDFNAGR